MATSATKRQRTGYLAEPLSADERDHITEMYRKHRGLVRLLGRKLCAKYPFVRAEDIFSNIDTAFIKTCRAWDPTRGTFSTLLTIFAEGDTLHFIRDNNWLIKAPGNVRRKGQIARRLLERGFTSHHICTELEITETQLKLALFATQPTDHDVKGFDLHICPRPTPWETLEEDESGKLAHQH